MRMTWRFVSAASASNNPNSVPHSIAAAAPKKGTDFTVEVLAGAGPALKQRSRGQFCHTQVVVRRSETRRFRRESSVQTTRGSSRVDDGAAAEGKSGLLRRDHGVDFVGEDARLACRPVENGTRGTTHRFATSPR